MAELKIDLRKVLTKELNDVIKNGVITGEISDGYHTFDELYAHRNILWFKLCEMLYDINGSKGDPCSIWKTNKDKEGNSIDGWFILGYTDDNHKQISYHMPNEFWDSAYFAKVLERNSEFDGHTSAEVLKRLAEL